MSRKDEIIFRRKDGRREARYVKLSGKRKETIERVFADAKEKHAPPRSGPHRTPDEAQICRGEPEKAGIPDTT